MKRRIFAVIISVLLVFSMVFSAAAEDFVNSVEVRKPPVVVPGPDGGYADVDIEGEETIKIPKEDLVVETIDSIDKEKYPDKAKSLEEATNELKESKDLDELVKNLQVTVDKVFPGKGASDLTVTDVFTVFVVGDSEAVIDNRTGEYTIRFKYDGETAPVVLIRNAAGEWETVDPSKVILENGVLKVTIPYLGEVAFLTANGIVENPQIISPQTGAKEIKINVGFIVCAVLASAAGVCAVVFVCFRRRRGF